MPCRSYASANKLKNTHPAEEGPGDEKGSDKMDAAELGAVMAVELRGTSTEGCDPASKAAVLSSRIQKTLAALFPDDFLGLVPVYRHDVRSILLSSCPAMTSCPHSSLLQTTS